jgi:hypothetical protein
MSNEDSVVVGRENGATLSNDLQLVEHKNKVDRSLCESTEKSGAFKVSARLSRAEGEYEPSALSVM